MILPELIAKAIEKSTKVKEVKKSQANSPMIQIASQSLQHLKEHLEEIKTNGSNK